MQQIVATDRIEISCVYSLYSTESKFFWEVIAINITFLNW
jgi:hypothetical protein